MWGGGELLERSSPPPHAPSPFKSFREREIGIEKIGY